MIWASFGIELAVTSLRIETNSITASSLRPTSESNSMDVGQSSQAMILLLILVVVECPAVTVGAAKKNRVQVAWVLRRKSACHQGLIGPEW
eukprot:117635-Rhodomonas_salina.3